MDGLSFSSRLRKRHWLWFSSNRASHDKFACAANRDADNARALQCCEFWQRSLRNKFNARTFAGMHDVPVAELYWTGTDIDAIPLDSLPDHYVIRPVAGWCRKNVALMANGVNMFTRESMTPEELRHHVSPSQMAERNLGVLVEEFVRTEGGQYRIPAEYQFYMFGEHLACICWLQRHGIHRLTRDRFYTPEWEPTPELMRTIPEGKIIAPPRCLDQMIEHARVLGRAYGTFVRVDLFATDRGSVFCEFAATPNMGGKYTDFANEYLGECWEKYCDDQH